MNKKNDRTNLLDAEVSQWVERLLTATGEQKQRAAAELSRLDVWSRGSIRTRGSLTEIATDRLPEPARLREVEKELADADKAVRCQVALALGEWGGPSAAAALQRMLVTEKDEEVQLHCITALRTIGGPAAAEALRQAAERGSEAVRDAALAAIEELATGGRFEDAEPPPTPQPENATAAPKPERRTRGVVRTRGTRQPKSSEDVIAGIAGSLQRIREDATASEYLRRRAEEVLALLRS